MIGWIVRGLVVWTFASILAPDRTPNVRCAWTAPDAVLCWSHQSPKAKRQWFPKGDVEPLSPHGTGPVGVRP